VDGGAGLALEGDERLVAWTAVGFGVVTDATPFLGAVDGLHRRVDVEYGVSLPGEESGEDVGVEATKSLDAGLAVKAAQSPVARIVLRKLIQTEFQTEQRVTLDLVRVSNTPA